MMGPKEQYKGGVNVGCQGRETHSLSSGCRPEEETERDVFLKVKGGQEEKKG